MVEVLFLVGDRREIPSAEPDQKQLEPCLVQEPPEAHPETTIGDPRRDVKEGGRKEKATKRPLSS